MRLSNVTLITDGSGSPSWQLKTASYTAVPGDRLRLDATNGDVIVTLPASPSSSDADMLFQRVDTSSNKVLLRTGANEFVSEVRKDGVLAGSHIEGVSYINSTVGWLNQYNRLTFQAVPQTLSSFAISADGTKLNYSVTGLPITAAAGNLVLTDGSVRTLTFVSSGQFGISGDPLTTAAGGNCRITISGSTPALTTAVTSVVTTNGSTVAPPPPGDPHNDNVTFLLRATSSGFSDLTGRSITSSGATLSTTARFGGYSVFVNGNISIPNPETLISPVGDWTIDFIYRNAGASSYGTVFSLDGSDHPLSIYFGGVLGPNMFAAVGTHNTWYEPSLVLGVPSTELFDYYGLKREGNTISSWKNGTQLSAVTVSSTSPIGIPATAATLGLNGSSNFCVGYYDDFRITNGIARDLTVIPTSKFEYS